MNLTVEDVMTSRVVALRKTASYKEIAGALRRHRVSACPVIDEASRVIGVVAEADLLYKEAEPSVTSALQLRWPLRATFKAAAVTAAQLMTSPAVTISAQASLGEAARLMQSRRVRRLPVTGRDGRLAGIVSRPDILSVFERPDDEIRDCIVKTILTEEFTLSPADVEVSVSAGIVTLTGQMPDVKLAQALLVRIRHADGVVGVRNRLTCPPDEPVDQHSQTGA